MTLSRMVGLLLILGAMSLGVVCLRAEEARTARRIQRIQQELVAIRRELWSVQLAIARHKSPGCIGAEIDHRGLQVKAPVPPRSGGTTGARWASVR